MCLLPIVLLRRKDSRGKGAVSVSKKPKNRLGGVVVRWAALCRMKNMFLKSNLNNLLLEYKLLGI